MNIIVVGNSHRRALVTPYLKGYDFRFHDCIDYDLPPGWVDRHHLIHNSTGCLRAFRGHQDALAQVKTDTLVLEDDAVPHVPNWTEITLKALSYLSDFDWISLHGREFDLKNYLPVADLGHGFTLYTIFNSTTGINGCCMAYWIKLRTAERFRLAVFDGFPCDWYLWQRFHAAIVHPSPFFHDRSEGSLIDVGARV